MKFGVHTSISGGIDRAVTRAADLNCDTLQVFCSNPRGWKVRAIEDKEVEKIEENLQKYNLGPLVVHSSYLINLASPKDDLYQKSITAIKEELRRADLINSDYYVLHPGSHTGSGKEKGIQRIVNALEEVFSTLNLETTILLENVAGAGTAIGSSLQELKSIFAQLSTTEKLGICFDTCHGFAAGYNLRDAAEVEQLLAEIDNLIGLDKLGVIHANDCKGDVGSNKDRHHHIGYGKIGEKGFKHLLRRPELESKPFILETPVDEQRDDADNLASLRQLQPKKIRKKSENT